MKIKDLRWILLAASLVVSVGHARAACSNATLHGAYAFTLTGQILAPPPAAGLVSGVARTEFDGRGNLTQVDHVVHNGVLPAEEWRPAIGAYSINSDCTGWMTINPQPADPIDSSPELKLYVIVTEGGHEIRTVVSDSPTTPPFAANITSIGIRIAPGERGRW